MDTEKFIMSALGGCETWKQLPKVVKFFPELYLGKEIIYREFIGKMIVRHLTWSKY